jgi:hypothetical protein
MAKDMVNPPVEAPSGGHPFPHRLSFLLDNPLRSLLISPETLVERLSLRPDARVRSSARAPASSALPWPGRSRWAASRW